MKWDQIKLGDAATFINGYPFKPTEWSENGREIIRIQNLTKSTDIKANRFDGKIAERYLVKKGDLLISWSGTLGVYEWDGEDAWLNQHIFKVVLDKKDINKKYFKYLIQSKISEFERQVHGATMKHITKGKFDNIQIPLPPLPIQQQISDTLDKADALRKKDQELLDKYDELAQAVFYEMFGDPIRNEKGWRKAKVKEIALVKIGPFGSLLHKEDYIIGGTPLINPSHIFKGKITEDSNLTISDLKLLELENYKLQIGDIIMGRRGEMGRCALISQREDGWLCGTGSLFIRINSQQLLPNFLNTVLSHQSMKKEIEALAKGVTMLNLNQSSIENLNITIPPLSLQMKYTSAKEEIDKKRDTLKKSTTKSLELFKYISSEYLN